MPTPRLDLALAAAAMGWEVHPCLDVAEGDRKAKTPHTRWKDEATTDPATIRAWWTRWPTALVGARTGSGIVVLDFDTDPTKGLEARVAQSTLEGALGPLPCTVVSNTPRGGCHLYFTTPTPMRSGAGVLGIPGADIRGEGGYVILYGDHPPDPDALATIPGPYATHTQLAHSAAPPPVPPPTNAPHATPNAATMQRVAEHLSTLDSPPEGTRHEQVLSMARLIGGYVGGGHLAYADALTMLDDACKGHADAADSFRAIRAGLMSGMAAPLHPGTPQPRPIPPTAAGTAPPPFARTTKTIKGGGVVDVPSFPNAVLDLLALPDFSTLQADTFRGTMSLDHQLVTDATMLQVRLDLYRLGGTNYKEADVEAAVSHVATNIRGVNPVAEYLQGLRWDGVPRIHDWLGRSFGITTTPQERAYQRKFFLCLAARILQPGCKVDDCLSILGPPGVKKSTLFRALVPSPDLFTDSHMDLENKDTFLKLRRVCLVEIGEERDFLRGGQEATKRFLSTQEDFYRAPFGRTVESHPRHCVFVITTNARRPSIFMDFTGEGRRYWPISLYDRQGLHDADVRWLEAHRDQLWAEAIVAFRSGELHYFDTPEDKLAHQQHFRQYLDLDPTDLQVEAALEALRKDSFTLGEVLERMRVPISEYGKNTRRVTASLERLQYEVTSYTYTKNRNRVPVWASRTAPATGAPSDVLPFVKKS
jgi:hypothetical protein